MSGVPTGAALGEQPKTTSTPELGEQMRERHSGLEGKRLFAGTAVAVLLCSGPLYAQQAPPDNPNATGSAAQTNDQAPTTAQQSIASSGQLQEVTVTAERRTENLQAVPMAVTALAAPQLQAQGITSGQALNAMVPNVSIGNNSPTNQGVTVTIRGIPEVGLYVDGFWQPNLGFRQAGLNEVERVEILRGPQGTLFGRNTNGGAINYITQQPADAFHVHGAIEFGSFDHRDVDGSLDVPITDTLLTKWIASIDDQGGWLKSVTNNQLYGGQNNTDFRGDVLWKPTDKFSIRVTGEQSELVSDSTRVADYTNVNPQTVNSAWQTIYNVAMMNPAYGPYNFWTGTTEWLSRFNNIGGQVSCQYDGYNCPGGGRVGKWETTNNEPVLGDRVTTSQYTTTVTWNLSPKLNITNLAAYIGQDQTYNVNFFSLPNVGITDLRKTHSDYWSEELHLAGSLFNNKVDYLVGGYYLYTRTLAHSYRWAASEFFQSANPANPIVGPGNEPFEDPNLAAFLGAWIANNPGHLASDILSNGALSYKNGLLTLHDFSFGGGLQSPTDYNDAVLLTTTEDRSFFVNATWHALSQLDLQGGVRVAWAGGVTDDLAPAGALRTWLTPTLGGGGSGPGPLYTGGKVLLVQHPFVTNSIVTPMVTASWHFTPQDMVYARYAQGYTAGTTSLNAALNQYITLDPEVVKDYEVGVRSDWFNRRLQANLTAYLMDWDGRPVQTTFFDKTTGNFVFVSSSGGKSRADGFEFDVDAVPFQGFNVTASAAYLKTKWITFGAANVGPETPWSYAPEWTAHLAGQYRFILPNSADLSLRLDWGYVGSYQINSDIQRQIPGGFPAYGLLNARIQYAPSGANWNLQLFGTNLTDVAYFTSGYDDGSTWGLAYGELGQRRMLGIRAEYSY